MPDDKGTLVKPNAADETIPAVMTHEERAAVINKALDMIVAALPKYPEVETSQLKFVRRRLNVTDAFIAKSVTASENVTELESVSDTDDMKDFLECEAHIRPVLDRMNAVHGDGRFTLDARRAAVGSKARKVYGVAQTIARHSPASAEITEHVKNMRAELSISRKPRVSAAKAKAKEVKPTGSE